MELLPAQEQQQIIDTAANFLAHEFPGLYTGADLASLKKCAIIDGDDMVVGGAKIWMSWMRFTDW
jgi:alkylation response protein AidB-like acyl-CoA dehydrogenase